MNIEDYFVEFTQDLHAFAGSEGGFTRSLFVERMCSLVEADGFISTFTQVDYKHSQRGLAVDAWSFDEKFGKLTLFVADYRSSEALETLTITEIADAFKRLDRFLQSCLKKDFANTLDESMPVTELAWFVLRSHKSIKHISLVILSNARLSSKVSKLPSKTIVEIAATYEIWDFERIYRVETSGKAREDVEIDFCSFVERGIPCLPASMGGNSMSSFLVVMPGSILAKLYEKYGERLLEQNVRTFLQFRASVNKGMRNTIMNEPYMFFSYNNGICATAEAVGTTSNCDRLLSAKNLQIVNGGQTTASIFTALRKEAADLSQVYVQVKLSVVSPEMVEDVVPRISEYANTQNKVSAADFFSNHPFHRKIEEFSRRLWAPSPVGMVQQTHWFYERARGQYENKQANLSVAERKKFLLQNPKAQMFTKTDLAKYVRSFEGLPHEVSEGAQKNFSLYAGSLGRQWEKNEGNDFNELWFKRLIGQAIIFRHLDTLVLRAPWYSGYKANIVTYTIAKFSALVGDTSLYIDFSKIWELQVLPTPLADQLLHIAEKVATLLLSPPTGATSNISEWAKTEQCWQKVKALQISLSPDTHEYFVGADKARESEKEASRTDTIQEGIHAQSYVVEKGSAYWNMLLEWNSKAKKLTLREMDILNIACAIPRKIPSEKQAQILINTEARAKGEGFFPR